MHRMLAVCMLCSIGDSVLSFVCLSVSLSVCLSVCLSVVICKLVHMWHYHCMSVDRCLETYLCGLRTVCLWMLIRAHCFDLCTYTQQIFNEKLWTWMKQSTAVGWELITVIHRGDTFVWQCSCAVLAGSTALRSRSLTGCVFPLTQSLSTSTPTPSPPPSSCRGSSSRVELRSGRLGRSRWRGSRMICGVRWWSSRRRSGRL